MSPMRTSSLGSFRLAGGGIKRQDEFDFQGPVLEGNWNSDTSLDHRSWPQRKAAQMGILMQILDTLPSHMSHASSPTLPFRCVGVSTQPSFPST